jgi:hypothetical protein
MPCAALWAICLCAAALGLADGARFIESVMRSAYRMAGR